MRLCSLFSFCAIRVVDDHAPSEPCPHGLLCDELHLGGILGVKLKHSTRSSSLKGGREGEGEGKGEGEREREREGET